MIFQEITISPQSSIPVHTQVPVQSHRKVKHLEICKVARNLPFFLCFSGVLLISLARPAKAVSFGSVVEPRTISYTCTYHGTIYIIYIGTTGTRVLQYVFEIHFVYVSTSSNTSACLPRRFPSRLPPVLHGPRVLEVGLSSSSFHRRSVHARRELMGE